MRTSSSAFLCRKLWGLPSASPTSCICILSSWFWVSLRITRIMNPWRNVQMSVVGFWYQPFGFCVSLSSPPFRTTHQLPSSLQAEGEAFPHQEEESVLRFSILGFSTNRTPQADCCLFISGETFFEITLIYHAPLFFCYEECIFSSATSLLSLKCFPLWWRSHLLVIWVLTFQPELFNSNQLCKIIWWSDMFSINLH